MYKDTNTPSTGSLLECVQQQKATGIEGPSKPYRHEKNHSPWSWTVAYTYPRFETHS